VFISRTAAFLLCVFLEQLSFFRVYLSNRFSTSAYLSTNLLTNKAEEKEEDDNGAEDEDEEEEEEDEEE
jgi:hypothetical protein